MIATCLYLCVCHVESLNVSNFCLSHMSYASLSFLVLVSKYLSYCMRSMPFVVACSLNKTLVNISPRLAPLQLYASPDPPTKSFAIV